MAKRGVATDPVTEEECIAALQAKENQEKSAKQITDLINITRQGGVERERVMKGAVVSCLSVMASAMIPKIKVLARKSPYCYGLIEIPVPNQGDLNVPNPAPNLPATDSVAPPIVASTALPTQTTGPIMLTKEQPLFGAIMTAQGDVNFPKPISKTEADLLLETIAEAQKTLEHAKRIIEWVKAVADDRVQLVNNAASKRIFTAEGQRDLAKQQLDTAKQEFVAQVQQTNKAHEDGRLESDSELRPKLDGAMAKIADLQKRLDGATATSVASAVVPPSILSGPDSVPAADASESGMAALAIAIVVCVVIGFGILFL